MCISSVGFMLYDYDSLVSRFARDSALCRLALAQLSVHENAKWGRKKSLSSQEWREKNTAQRARMFRANKPSYHCAFLLQQRQHQNLIKNSLDVKVWAGRKGRRQCLLRSKVENCHFLLVFLHSTTARHASYTQWRAKNRSEKKRGERNDFCNDTSDASD